MKGLKDDDGIQSCAHLCRILVKLSICTEMSVSLRSSSLNSTERCSSILLYSAIFSAVALCHAKSFVWEVLRWWHCKARRLNVAIIARWSDVSENEPFSYVW